MFFTMKALSLEMKAPTLPESIPTPQGEGLGVGSVTSTPRDNVHTQSAENVILEKRKNNLWVKYPTPAPPLKG